MERIFLIVNMFNEKLMFSSDSDEWETPKNLFKQLKEEFDFSLDVAATPENTLCPNFFHKNKSGLENRWEGICWMNPPYSQIKLWCKKALFEVQQRGVIVVALIPSRTDTRYWSDYVMQADEIRFIKGRLKFSNSRNSAPFPSCVVIWRCWNGQVTTPEISILKPGE